VLVVACSAFRNTGTAAVGCRINLGSFRMSTLYSPERGRDAMVSLGERFLYNNGDPGMNPDPANAQLAYNLLLRET
jgi:hypothetical protein